MNLPSERAEPRKPKTLTKSRFKVAMECPRKLTYLVDDRYANADTDNDILNALAAGGHEVGALAKLMFPGGREVTSRSVEAQLAETQEHLSGSSIVLFEPTFQFENLLVRVDILVKDGNQVDLIEVKSKSFREDRPFRGKRGELISAWRPYLEDVAFQHHVLNQAMPAWHITPHLMLIDPTVAVRADSLATRIATRREGNRVSVLVDASLTAQDLVPALLKQHQVSAEVQEILAGTVRLDGADVKFADAAKLIADKVAAGEAFAPRPGKECRSCEFYCEPQERNNEHRSGWAECMSLSLGRDVDVSRAATIFGLNSDKSVEKRLSAGELVLSDLPQKADEGGSEITLRQRHALQIREAHGEPTERVLRDHQFRAALDTWRFPLHFIDFETSCPVIPFHRGHKPNLQLRFQFSHLVLDEKGRLEHRSQCLVTEPGVVPNAPVIRALKRDLSEDKGTVVHWWSHERTVLGHMRQYLVDGQEADRTELIRFIDDLLTPQAGRDRFVDLGLPLVSKLAFFSGTSGKSSIKSVLPAVLQQSDYLRQRYHEPVYGTAVMPSLNFVQPLSWVQYEDGLVRDPYELLDPLFDDPHLDQMIARSPSDDDAHGPFIRNGGAAMMAYAKLQRPDLGNTERARLMAQLKRYCELDTLAMVMIYEALREWVKR